MIDHAVFLFEGGIMFLVHHDQAQIRIGQEQGRPRADDDAGPALRHRPPGQAPARRAQIGMPSERRRAEALFESFQPLRRQADFWHQNQYLPAPGQGGGDGFQVDLRLAGAGDPIQQGGGIAARLDLCLQGCCRHRLIVAEGLAGLLPIGLGHRQFGGQLHFLQGAMLDQTPDHGGGDGGKFGYGRRRQGLTIGQNRHHTLPRPGHATGRRAGQGVGQARARRFQRRRYRHGHAQHRTRRGAGIIRQPFDKAAADLRHGRDGQPLRDGAETAVGHRIVRIG